MKAGTLNIFTKGEFQFQLMQKPAAATSLSGLTLPIRNPNVAVGALVGGSFMNKTYIDSRNNPIQGEPSTYNNALIVALLSGLVTTSPVGKTF